MATSTEASFERTTIGERITAWPRVLPAPDGAPSHQAPGQLVGNSADLACGSPKAPRPVHRWREKQLFSRTRGTSSSKVPLWNGEGAPHDGHGGRLRKSRSESTGSLETVSEGR
ncbi:hypothetical protein, unlikely [Trypanosoma congolense IL3000]|uniref:Uncharacterized protein n=1 Tax=Trypanosoma congolense (strain IL3000) TaxID=1068625 RepID=F9WJN0_TRYCI|nr:hypothetical protein, unlikely [Trypanosoma congolense IL3000]